MQVVVSEEMAVVKKEIIFSYVCTWNKFMQSQETCPTILEQIEAKLPSQSNTQSILMKWDKTVQVCAPDIFPIMCIIVGLVAYILHHQKAMKQTFLTIYITSL